MIVAARLELEPREADLIVYLLRNYVDRRQSALQYRKNFRRADRNELSVAVRLLERMNSAALLGRPT